MSSSALEVDQARSTALLAELNPKHALQAEVDTPKASRAEQPASPAGLADPAASNDDLPTLPTTRDDPAVVAGREAKSEYERTLAEVRRDVTLSDLERARRISGAYEQLRSRLVAAATDLHQRRVAHLEAIQSQLNVGADIPEGSTPADKAVLMQAFRAALDRARAMDEGQLQTEFRDAIRFGDDQMQRAIETVVLEEGRGSLRNAVIAANPKRGKVLAAFTEAEAAVTHSRAEDGWAWQAHRLPNMPDEARRLSGLEDAEAERQASLRGSFWPR
jgi:hypothetical protein